MISQVKLLENNLKKKIQNIIKNISGIILWGGR
jgi:hypothetical protein